MESSKQLKPKEINVQRRESNSKKNGVVLEDNRTKTTLQKKSNKTGLPDNLKNGIENLSGHAMDDVKVHYNSAKPAQLNAHAYAQGSQIHLASGQEKHLPHEAWHVVQQKQGRVKPTKQLKGNVGINDDKSLENEADVMGVKALQLKSRTTSKFRTGYRKSFKTLQRVNKTKKVRKRQKIQIGHRPGWPGTKMAHYVTHAVFRINGGTILGYGKPNRMGVIGPDSNLPPNVGYTWFAPTLLLPNQYIALFRAQVATHSAGFLYTGVGGNCFTPIYKSLIDVRATMIQNGSSQENINHVSSCIAQLASSNFGMGTKITNKMLTGALALGIIGLSLYNLLYAPSKGV